MYVPLTRLLILSTVSCAAYAASVTFNTFVSTSALDAGEGQHDTIGFTYAGDKFVGSVYNVQGPNNLQLYSTDLTGGNVQHFGSPLPSGSGEVAIAGSLGQGGFASGAIFAGPGSSGTIYQYGDAGGSPSTFVTGLSGGVRGILFDPGASFGGNMLVSTTTGSIYKVDSTGHATLLASTGEDTEGMEIIPTDASAYGALAGDLLAVSEGSGLMRIIDPSGNVTVATLSSGSITELETVNFVPLDLGLSGNPLEGYYAANFQSDIQYANAAQFAGLQGDLITTSETVSNSAVWDLHYTGGTSFTVTQVGNLPNQAEDGIFVTAQRIQDTAPEPGSVALMSLGLAALVVSYRRRTRA